MDSEFTRKSRAKDPPNTASETPLPKAAPVIVLPSIPTARKSQYTDVPEALVAFGAEFEIEDIDCIIGEHVLDDKLYYFVRFKDGLAHKVHFNHFVLTRHRYFLTRFRCSCWRLSSRSIFPVSCGTTVWLCPGYF
jgi:hypothetical protein